MRSDVSAQDGITAKGNYFSRAGRKFLFKAMRLPDVGASLNFDQKLALRNRLEDLKLAHTTGLVVTQVQSQPVLDIAAQAGMVAMLETGVALDDLVDRRRWRSLISRVGHTAVINRGHRALGAYVIDCQIERDELNAVGPIRARRRLRELIRTIKSRDPHVMVAIAHRADALALALKEEDFAFVKTPALDPIDLHEFIDKLRKVIGSRPAVIEFSETSIEQDAAIAAAFAAGAAGVIARPVALPGAHDWLGIRMLRAAERMPFAAFDAADLRAAEMAVESEPIPAGGDQLERSQSENRAQYQDRSYAVAAAGLVNLGRRAYRALGEAILNIEPISHIAPARAVRRANL